MKDCVLIVIETVFFKGLKIIRVTYLLLVVERGVLLRLFSTPSPKKFAWPSVPLFLQIFSSLIFSLEHIFFSFSDGEVNMQMIEF